MCQNVDECEKNATWLRINFMLTKLFKLNFLFYPIFGIKDELLFVLVNENVRCREGKSSGDGKKFVLRAKQKFLFNFLIKAERR